MKVLENCFLYILYVYQILCAAQNLRENTSQSSSKNQSITEFRKIQFTFHHLSPVSSKFFENLTRFQYKSFSLFFPLQLTFLPNFARSSICGRNQQLKL